MGQRHARRIVALAGCGLAAGLWAIPAGAHSDDDPDNGARTTTPATASATLVDVNGEGVGTAHVTASDDGSATVQVEAWGLSPGLHGTHFHMNGVCEPGPDPSGTIIAFGAAGGHYDPGETANHDRPEVPAHVGHGGDLPNLEIDADGRGSVTFDTTDIVAPDGSLAVVGRSVVIHADEDDYMTDPAGNSGARIACGVVTAENTADDADAGQQVAPGTIVDSYELPGEMTFPEGIAYDTEAGVAYVGSTTDGTIYRIDVESGETEIFAPGGAPGLTSAVGMKLDGQGHLLVAGGGTGVVAVFDVTRKHPGPVTLFSTPPAMATFLNDITVAEDGYAYVTDSQRPVLFRLRSDGEVLGPLEPWLDFTGTPLEYVEGFNLNGIATAPNGEYLVAVQGNTGQLWRIDIVTKEVSEIDLGGATVTAGDGLLFTEDESLWVARNAASTLVRLEVAEDGTSASVQEEITNTDLLFPTTLAEADGDLLVVNGQLNRLMGPTPPVLPFTVSRVSVTS